MKVTATETSISVFNGEDVSSLDLQQIKSIALEVVPAPYGTDIFWHLVGEGRSLVFPMEADGQAEALEILQKLLGFDNVKIFEALNAEEGIFLIWPSD